MAFGYTDIKELDPFRKMFESLTHRHSDHELWNDFLEIIICCYSMQQMEERYLHIIKKYKKEEVAVLTKMFAEIVVLYSKNLCPQSWYDGLGAFYETYINTPAKASRTGQFFTPETVCDMMARCMLNPEHAYQKLTINDCACGSGRLLLAAGAVAPGNFFFAEDTDPMCCLLTTVNFLLHSMEGQIVCHNSLLPEDFRFGYEVKRLYAIAPIPIPIVRSITQEEALVCQTGKVWRQEREDEMAKNEDGKKAETASASATKLTLTARKKEAVKQPKEQMSLF